MAENIKLETASLKTADAPQDRLQDRWSDVCPLILAAGKGTRMNGNGNTSQGGAEQTGGGRENPKVLCKLHGKSLIEHTIDHVLGSQLSLKPMVVVGYGAEDVKNVLGQKVHYVEQEEQLGTGHAVMAARARLEGACTHVLVLYGDHPYVPSYIINELVSLHKGQGATLTLCTTVVSDFEAWRKDLYAYGRIVRDAAGSIQKIVERKDATPVELDIKELNVGYYCFKAEWLWGNLEHLLPANSQKEYYLTDLIEIALAQHEIVKSLTIDPLMSIGVNTPEQLEQAEKLLFRK